jgi:hypothetical protein
MPNKNGNFGSYVNSKKNARTNGSPIKKQKVLSGII